MNDKFNLVPYKLRVSPETEEFFNDSFWENLDFAINALDNIPARLYVDGRYLFVFCLNKL